MNCRAQTRRSAGFTLPELMVAAVIGLILGGTTMLLLLQSSITNATVFTDVSLDEAANNLQGSLINYLRAMGGGGGAQATVYTNITGAVPPAGLCYCLRVPYQVTSSGNGVTSQINYDPAVGQITYLPNYATTNGQSILLATNSHVSVGVFGFFPSIKGNGDGTMDLSLVNVTLELIHRSVFPQPKTNIVWRTFSVRMRTFP